MRRFLFDDREYRISPPFKRRCKEQDSTLALTRLLGKSGGGSRGSKGTGGFGGATRHRDTRQKCVVKMQYSDGAGAHRVQLEKYLAREGTDIDGGRAKLYGTDPDEYRANMTGRNFRVFLSPQSDRANLTELTEKFVKKLELQTGYSLTWQAANHHNTAHPHSHLLINGKDRNGREVAFSRDMVRTFMRENARDTLTSMIGGRTRKEMALEKEAELSARRHTRLDETIKKLCDGTFRPRPENAGANRDRVLARLENLRGMGLCAWERGGYMLSPRWEENLRSNGRYNTFLKARERLTRTDPSALRVYSGEHGTVTGKVTSVYRTDGDASNAHAVVVECPDGKAYFIPTLKAPEVHDGNGRRHPPGEGDTVTVKTRENQRGRLTPIFLKAGVRETIGMAAMNIAASKNNAQRKTS